MWAITSNIQHLQIKILTTFALLQKTIMTKNIYLHTSDLVIKERWIGFLLNTSFTYNAFSYIMMHSSNIIRSLTVVMFNISVMNQSTI